MSTLLRLDAGYQNYAWGKSAETSFVARMKGLTGDTSGKKYAELWVGTHPSCPSYVLATPAASADDKSSSSSSSSSNNKETAAGGRVLLDEYLRDEANKTRFLSPAHQASSFRDTVPYLLKILSIGTALSIQAHPCKRLAEQLHAAKPDKYKDPNHKPELICALTPFEALCCFRTLPELTRFLRAIPELATLMGAAAVLGEAAVQNNNNNNNNSSSSSSTAAVSEVDERAALKALMSNLYAADATACTTALRAHLQRVTQRPQCVEDALFARVYGQYPDDVGCWMVYVLNYVQLAPGQALFLADSEPHAYLSGEGVEIMACSDNVVRAGLTPKWKDVQTLIDMLKYDTTGLAAAKHDRATTETASRWQVQLYQPPAQFPDFSLYRCEYAHDDGGDGSTTIELPTIGLGFCVEGAAVVNGATVRAGDCFAVPYGSCTCKASGQRSLVFVASSNTPLSAASPSRSPSRASSSSPSHSNL